MGRTTPTYVQLVADIIAKRSAKFRRALRREDQKHFDRLVSGVRYFSPSGLIQNSDDPRECVVLSVLLDHETRVAAMEAKLRMPPVHVPAAQPLELFSPLDNPSTTSDDEQKTEEDGNA
jgi:hypothetical protein